MERQLAPGKASPALRGGLPAGRVALLLPDSGQLENHFGCNRFFFLELPKPSDKVPAARFDFYQMVAFKGGQLWKPIWDM